MKHFISHEDLPFNIFQFKIERSSKFWFGCKTVEEFRKDVQIFLDSCKNTTPFIIEKSSQQFFEERGYTNISELISDKYVGKILVTSARIVQTESQNDCF